MVTLGKRFGLAVLGALTLWGLAAPAAQAQLQWPVQWFDPYGNARRAAFNIALYGAAMRQVPPYALGYNPYPQIVARTAVAPPYMNPALGAYGLPGYGGTLVNQPVAAGGAYAGSPGLMSSVTDPYYNPYYNSYVPYWDPYSGFLRGTAEIIAAEGRFRVNNEQSKLMHEQVRQARIDTRRRVFDEWLYERATLPRVRAEERERLAEYELRYHLSSPAATDIYSATSLNTILDKLQKMQGEGLKGPTIPLDEDLLKQINVTTGAGGNVGLLKNDGRLLWPLALSGSEFEIERKNLDRNIPQAVSEVEKHGQVDRGRLKDMMADADKMYERLAGMIGDLTPTQYIEAKRYLNQLNDALRVLQTPDAGNYFTGKYVARGKSVGELVKNMAGLKFAPATPGEEKAYRELYQALAAFYGGASRQQPAPRDMP
jgi:hypothetical protein